MKRTASSIKKAAPVCKRRDRRPLPQAPILIACALLLLWAPLRVGGDQVEMQNGDRYAGHVLSLNTNTVVLQSDVLGTLRLPRSKVAVITLGSGPVTNSPSLASLTNAPVLALSTAPTNKPPKPSPAFAQLGASTNLI